MREKLKRRLRIILPLGAVAAVLGLTAWIGAKLRSKPVDPSAGDALVRDDIGKLNASAKRQTP
jgi:hypothetical protein